MAAEEAFNLSTTKPEKQVFQLKKSRRDGLLLQVHHSVPGRDGEVQRVRFTATVFDEKGERLAAVDHRGNVFIIDLQAHKFWLLPSLGICTVVTYSTHSNNTLVIGTTDCSLNFMNTETGSVTHTLRGHSLPVRQVSFSSQGQFCLSVSLEEVIVWNLTSGCMAHRLAVHTDVSIKQVWFIPGSNCVLVCFQDDSMNVWNFESLECVKRIVPDAWKGNQLKTITFTRNGRAMVVGGHSPQLVVFSLDVWSVKNCIQLPDHVGGVKHMQFLPQEFDAGANKILVMLSTNCVLYFLDMESGCFLETNLPEGSSARKFACSPSGRYVATVLHSGEVNIYQSSRLLDLGGTGLGKAAARGGTAVEKKPWSRSVGTRQQQQQQQKQRSLEQQMKAELDVRRLQPILKQFGEYPELYRCLIWRTVLRLPGNQAAFVSLVNRECHPAHGRVGEASPRESRTVMKNLRRVLSCLAHWCPLFGELPYLHQLALPFVAVFQNNPLDCFELLLTIILNWCQHWFEYFPHAPTNVLSMVENVLGEHDPQLLQFLYEQEVSSELYVWSVLRTGFSQVLSRKQWCVLWDHVLSNEPAFLLMAVAAYTTVCRAAVRSCKSQHHFQFFYHNKNALDMKRFLSKCYQLLDVTSEDIHPRQYLRGFQPLEQGAYPVFTSYAKCTVDHHVQLLEDIRAENERLANECRAVMEKQVEKEHSRNRQALQEQHEERLRRAEEALRAEILKEERHVAQQQRKVLQLKKELRERELRAAQEAADGASSRQARERQASLTRTLDLLRLKGCREEEMVAALEDEVKAQLDQLKIKKLWQTVDRDASEHERREATEGRDIASSMALVEQLAEQINQELAKETASSQHNEQATDTSRKRTDEMKPLNGKQMSLQEDMPSQLSHQVLELESQTRLLEGKVVHLLEKMADRRRCKDSDKDGSSRATTRLQDTLQGGSLDRHVRETRVGDPKATSKNNTLSVRSWDVYHREKQAIKNAMAAREKLLRQPVIARRHPRTLNCS